MTKPRKTKGDLYGKFDAVLDAVLKPVQSSKESTRYTETAGQILAGKPKKITKPENNKINKAQK